jgi:oligopeptide transport system substrate-binding protein
MNVRRGWLPLLFFLAALLAVVGCTGTAATTTTSASGTPTTSTTPTPGHTVPAGHGTLTLAGTDPYTLDPALAAEANSNMFVSQIFGGLVRFDENLNVVPDIAENWDVSPDGLTYTFHLRHDVVFQDGTAVTSADVVYSWERSCDPATGSTVAATYLGDIAGALDKLAGKASSISGLSAPDAYTVKVTIDAPKSYFLSKLTYPTAFVVDKKNVAQGADWYRHPNGTGPFKLTEWTQGQSITLARNTRYYGQVATLEQVHFLLLSGVPMDQYESGDIDATGVSSIYVDRVQDPAGPFYGQLQVSPELSFSFIGFNTTTAPFDDVHVRRAFTYALDKDKIISIMFRDLVQKADGILPPGMPGFNPNLKGLDYDVAKAKQELALSSYGSAANLPPITITTAGYGGGVNPLIEAAVVQWRDNLGVDVTIRQMEPDRYYYNLTAEKNEMFDMGWIADYPNPQDFLDLLFHTGAQNNFGQYSNPAVDALLDRAAVAEGSAALDLYQQVEQMLVDDAACLPFSFGEDYTLVKPYVHGYKVDPMGLVAFNRVTTDQ